MYEKTKAKKNDGVDEIPPNRSYQKFLPKSFNRAKRLITHYPNPPKSKHQHLLSLYTQNDQIPEELSKPIEKFPLIFTKTCLYPALDMERHLSEECKQLKKMEWKKLRVVRQH